MADLDLDALDALAAAATPGPWEVEFDGTEPAAVYADDGGIGTAYICRDLAQGVSYGEADAAFIAAAREAVPALTARVRELEAGDTFLRLAQVAAAERDEARAENARLRAQVDAVTALCDEYVRSGIRWLAESEVRAALATGAES